MLPGRRILSPADFSGPACTCVRAASELAEHFGAELLLVNVVPALPGVPPDPNYVFKIPEYEKYLHAEATERLSKASQELVSKKGEGSYHGRPWTSRGRDCDHCEGRER